MVIWWVFFKSIMLIKRTLTLQDFQAWPILMRLMVTNHQPQTREL